MKGVQLSSPTSLTPLLESGGLEKKQKFTLDTFATRQFGLVAREFKIVANFDKMPTCEKSHGNGDFCAKFYHTLQQALMHPPPIVFET